MKKVYGYIRVSTVKQGTGVSLQEQKEAIVRYAEKHDLSIVEWFEEKETAAKQGRTLFTKMMKLLQAGKTAGVIIHKIDRSARNLKDWASLGDLIDKGIEVHFAHESLDMDTRGGRLAADIQAVIASDYIRNLRDETLKGLYGRLKQGIYPFGAPIGYIDNGGGQLKTIDPVQGPLIKKAFEIYATENYGLHALANVMKEFGFRNSKGNYVSVTTLSKILNNPFYAGILKIKGKIFPGGHEPLVSSQLFNHVQDILTGKTNSRPIKHSFIFRRSVKCAECGYSLIGEKQKGYVYYRCHLKVCPTTGIREDSIERFLFQSLAQMQLHPMEKRLLMEIFLEWKNDWTGVQKNLEESLKIQQGHISQKLKRLTDAYIDNAIDKDLFDEKKENLHIELRGLQFKTGQVSSQKALIFKKTENFLELIQNVKKSYSNAIPEEKRKIIKSTTSNLTIQGKNLMIAMKSPFYEIANRSYFTSGDPLRHTPRIDSPQFVENDNLVPEIVDIAVLRSRMENLLLEILKYFAVLDEKGELEEEDNTYDV